MTQKWPDELESPAYIVFKRTCKGTPHRKKVLAHLIKIYDRLRMRYVEDQAFEEVLQKGLDACKDRIRELTILMGESDLEEVENSFYEYLDETRGAMTLLETYRKTYLERLGPRT